MGDKPLTSQNATSPTTSVRIPHKQPPTTDDDRTPRHQTTTRGRVHRSGRDPLASNTNGNRPSVVTVTALRRASGATPRHTSRSATPPRQRRAHRLGLDHPNGQVVDRQQAVRAAVSLGHENLTDRTLGPAKRLRSSRSRTAQPASVSWRSISTRGVVLRRDDVRSVARDPASHQSPGYRCGPVECDGSTTYLPDIQSLERRRN